MCIFVWVLPDDNNIVYLQAIWHVLKQSNRINFTSLQSRINISQQNQLYLYAFNELKSISSKHLSAKLRRMIVKTMIELICKSKS